ncbi:hypothetical protein ACOSQ3_026412 [Xanthoceras sorbifolium]
MGAGSEPDLSRAKREREIEREKKNRTRISFYFTEPRRLQILFDLHLPLSLHFPSVAYRWVGGSAGGSNSSEWLRAGYSVDSE